MRAYCYSTGRIEFDTYCPKGALPIARSRSARKLKELVSAHARVAWEADVLLVPGIPEAPNQVRALEELEKFISRLGKAVKPEDKIIVFTRAHRWPIAGKGSNY